MSARRKRREGERFSPRERDQLTSSVNYLYHKTSYTGAQIAHELHLAWSEVLDLVMKRSEWEAWQAARDGARDGARGGSGGRRN